MKKITVEVCVDNFQSIVKASDAGADRFELCSALNAEGLTPTPGMVQFAKQRTNCSLQAMIRSRPGDFWYNEDEQKGMLFDFQNLIPLGIDGIVIGALTQDGDIDLAFMKPFIALAKQHNLALTFHRAIDLANNYFDTIRQLIDLGFTRILTSGQAKNVMEGIDNIAMAQREFGHKIQIMPGGGINPENIIELVSQTKVEHIHCSASSKVTRVSGGGVFPAESLQLQITSKNTLGEIIGAFKTLKHKG
jgi:copper homeostasis protein